MDTIDIFAWVRWNSAWVGGILLELGGIVLASSL